MVNKYKIIDLLPVIKSCIEDEPISRYDNTYFEVFRTPIEYLVNEAKLSPRFYPSEVDKFFIWQCIRALIIRKRSVSIFFEYYTDIFTGKEERRRIIIFLEDVEGEDIENGELESVLGVDLALYFPNSTFVLTLDLFTNLLFLCESYCLSNLFTKNKSSNQFKKNHYEIYRILRVLSEKVGLETLCGLFLSPFPEERERDLDIERYLSYINDFAGFYGKNSFHDFSALLGIISLPIELIQRVEINSQILNIDFINFAKSKMERILTD